MKKFNLMALSLTLVSLSTASHAVFQCPSASEVQEKFFIPGASLNPITENVLPPLKKNEKVVNLNFKLNNLTMSSRGVDTGDKKKEREHCKYYVGDAVVYEFDVDTYKD